ncbi:MAG TPA: NADPH-dependent F420 reductase [Polyangiaceae bacterium]|nr:NADPH-dependent F420 reductase [Polyangiaceae bacterium]
MIIGILGGTGKEGSGLSLRWARAGHTVVIGSRDEGRARAKGVELTEKSGGTVLGKSNADAATQGDIVVVAVPFAVHRSLLEQLRPLFASKVVIDTVVPLDFKAKHSYAPPPEGSAAEEAEAILGDGAHVVAALHQIAAHELASLEHAIEADGFYCGNDPTAKARVHDLVAALGVRPIDAGPLKNAPLLESMTPLLIELNKQHKVKSAGIRLTGI